MQNLEDAARAACAAIGVEYKPVPPDGNWHTADLLNDPRGKSDGRIKLFPDRQGGIAWNFKTGQQQTFFINRKPGEPIPAAEQQRIETAKKQRAEQEQQTQHQAAQKTAYIWHKAAQAQPSHPYLIRKQIKPHGAKIAISGALILPVYDHDNQLVNLQFIHTDGNKRFLKNGRKKGCFWWLGKPEGKPETILIAEGFSTASSLFEATGHLTYIAFDAGNLEAVAWIVRNRYPYAKIVICSDNDASGTGQRYSNQAAAAIDGYVAMPPDGMDFNDWACSLKPGGNDGQ